MVDLKFYKNKRVFITGHTGFKGSWLTKILKDAGAVVCGYSLAPPTTPSLFEIAKIDEGIQSVIGDICDYTLLKRAFDTFKPEIVLHLAAQPLVRYSYQSPKETYETNVIGTVNILECIRLSNTVKSFVNVTTDKVYLNKEWEWGYRENEQLDGFDPYSNSKSCSELVTHSYKNSFFGDSIVRISTARAGNVIGGGDFALDRIIPDCKRAVIDKKQLVIRNPNSTRPYQHVLEPLFAYLLLAQRQYVDKDAEGWYNVGPDECDCVSTGVLVELFSKACGEGFSVKIEKSNGPHEANFLKLDCSKFKAKFNWRPKWDIATAIKKTTDWLKEYLNGKNIDAVMTTQIKEYLQN